MEERELPTRAEKPVKKYNYIIWTDGSIAGFKETYINYATGKRKFIFVPTDDMAYRKNIQESDYEVERGYIIKEYDDDLCIDESTSADSIKWFIYCDYEGNTTSAIKFLNQKLLTQNRALKAILKEEKMASLIHRKESFKREAHRENSDKKTWERLRNLKTIFADDEDKR